MMKPTNHSSRRTKIIATLGPANDSEEAMSALIAAGVDMVRLNFSHGTQADHQKRFELVKRLAEKHHKIIGVLADLQGPKIRIACFKNGVIQLQAGELFTLDAALDMHTGDEKQVGIAYKALPNDVKKNDILKLDDGRITLKVKQVKAKKIICTVIVGGKLSNNKGINREGGGLTAKALTKKDKDDLAFALKMGADFIAISFPRDANDVKEAQQLIAKHQKNPALRAGVIAKIERTEAMHHIEEIIDMSDGVMVARGDLAIEIGDAEVPAAQKEIIHLARAHNKPVITATQMMESMIQSTIPTRAEVSDVANAVLDYSDAVMLSEETAMGAHPPLVVKAMARVCEMAEKQPRSRISAHRLECHFERIDEAIAMATMYTANHLDIKAIITLTESGRTALWMSRIRSSIPIYALSRNLRTLGKLTLYRGVYPVYFDVTQCTNEEVNHKAIETLVKCKAAKNKDLVILTKGDRLGVGGGSNVMKILVVGQAV
ncbi:MAG TPA: pyruvate kinase [Coxiellaceae bacterium]|nr:pyruvate kinase [Coxiellaceae bacterium]